MDTIPPTASPIPPSVTTASEGGAGALGREADSGLTLPLQSGSPQPAGRASPNLTDKDVC